jgi:UDP-N-acetylmuramyl-tripeptide synthetase
MVTREPDARTVGALCAPWPELSLEAGADEPVTSVVEDSRAAGPGSLFVAVPGTRADGHRFLPAALAAGCRALLVARDRVEDARAAIAAMPELHTAPPALVVAERTRGFPALLARELAGRPDAELVAAGVTGTNGKTSTAFMLQALLAVTVGRCGLLGTVRYDDGHEIVQPAPLTTPSGPALYPWLRRLCDRGGRAVALEVSSHALDQERVAGLALDVAVLTNLSRDHLDYHGTMDDYLAAKARIVGLAADGPRRDKAAGAVVINAGDPALAALPTGDLRTVRYAVREVPDGAADLVLRDLELRPDASRLELAWRGRRVTLTSPLAGRFNAENLVAALAAGCALGTDVADAAAALAEAPPAPGRFERFSLPAGGVAVVDYAHTPDALAAVLGACRELPHRRLLVVFGCGGDRDRGKRPLMGEVAAGGADRIWVTSDNPRGEDPAAICADIVAGISAARARVESEVVVDRETAIRAALNAAGAGDVVVIAGKGHEDYQIVGDHRRHLDDGEIVRAWIAAQEDPGADRANAPSSPADGREGRP